MCPFNVDAYSRVKNIPQKSPEQIKAPTVEFLIQSKPTKGVSSAVVDNVPLVQDRHRLFDSKLWLYRFVFLWGPRKQSSTCKMMGTDANPVRITPFFWGSGAFDPPRKMNTSHCCSKNLAHAKGLHRNV